MKHRWMPVFWGDFLANTMHLSAQEVGAYFLLIAHAWEHSGAIPYNHARRIARIASPHWPRVRATLEPFFEVERDAKGLPCRYYQHRVLAELSIANELSKKRKASALQKYSKRTASASQLASVVHMQNRVPSPRIGSSLEEPRARATGVDKSSIVDEETPQGVADKKRPDEISRQDLETMYAAKRTAGEE